MTTTDVADDLAFIVRNAIKYIKELETQVNDLRIQNIELDKKLAEMEIYCPPCNNNCNQGRDCPARKR